MSSGSSTVSYAVFLWVRFPLLAPQSGVPETRKVHNLEIASFDSCLCYHLNTHESGFKVPLMGVSLLTFVENVRNRYFPFFMDKIFPWVFLVLVLGGGIGTCRTCIKTIGEEEREEKKKLEESGMQKESDAFIDGIGRTFVIHDEKHQVTCIQSPNGISCLPDKDVKR